MTRRISSAAVIAAAFCALPAVAQTEPLEIEELAGYPAIANVSMSAEGDMLVGLVRDPTKDGKEQAAAYWDISGEIDTSKQLVPDAITPSNGRMRFIAAGALKQGQSFWIAKQPWTGRLAGCGEGKMTGATRTFVQKLYIGNRELTDIDEPPQPREIGLSSMNEECLEITGTFSLEETLPLDPDNIIVSQRTPNTGIRYYKYNLRTDRREYMFSDNDRPGVDQISRVDGQPISKIDLDFTGGAYMVFTYLIDPQTGQFTKEDPLTVDIADRYQMDVLGTQKGTDQYFILTDKFSDKAQIYLYDPGSDQFSAEPVFAHPDFSATGIIWSNRKRDFDAPIGFTYAGATEETYWLDPEFKAVSDGLAQAFDGKNVSIIDYTESLDKILFSTSSSASPPAYYLLLDKGKVALVGDSRPWIDEDTLSKTELVYYEARDGLQIPALLTLPNGVSEGQRVRGGIVLPHGGPWARDYANWDGSGWTQFLASRGYAVLQPQYRGSRGWGRELWLAGDREWGQKMQDDKDDGADWLVEQGYVAPDKLAIFGYSYGGFAAMAATVRPDGPFQCAIAGAGVSNLAKIQNSWGESRVQRALQGDTVDGMDPLANASKADIPILVYHGDRDVRVPLFHGEDFYNAVKDIQPESRYLEVDDMPHSLPWWPEQHRETLGAIEDFLSTTCGMGRENS